MKLEAIRALLDAATPGPWHPLPEMHKSVKPEHRIAGVHSVECKIYHAKLDPICIKETHDRQRADARLIATARTLLPLLLDAIEGAVAVNASFEVHWDPIGKGYAMSRCDIDPLAMQVLRNALAEIEAYRGT